MLVGRNGHYAKKQDTTARVAPTAIVTGRYSGVCIDERKCFSCKDIVEDETRFTLLSTVSFYSQ